MHKSLAMPRTGRPTNDPKNHKLTVRLAPRDLEALQAVAEGRAGGLAEAARSVLREALCVPPLPPNENRRRAGSRG